MNGNDHASDSAQGNQPQQQSETQDNAVPQLSQSPADSGATQQEQHFFHPSDAAGQSGEPGSEIVPQPPQEAASTGGPQQADVRMEDSGRGVSWTASEFIAHHKPPEWYMAVGIITVALAAIVYFMSHDLFGVVIMVLVGVIFGVAASRPPRQIQYAVDGRGVHMGRHFYPYGNFRSFTIAPEGPFLSVVLMPLKRFMPVLSMYIDPADENRIGDILADHLPMHEHHESATDRLMRRIRF